MTVDNHRALLDEPTHVRQALMRAKGNVMGAARLLGLSRSALPYRMHRYGIARSDVDRLPGELGTTHMSSPRAEEDPGGGRVRHSLPSPPSPTRGEGELYRASDGEESSGTPHALSAADARIEPVAIWEQKPVVVLVIDLTFPKASGPEAPRYEPWTVASRWERTIAEKVHGFGGLLLPGAPSLLTVFFGIPRALGQMPQRAVQAALAIRRLVAEAESPARDEPSPEVRLAVHLGEVVVDARDDPPAGGLLAVGNTLSLPVRLLGLAAPGDILVSPQAGWVLQGWFELQPRQLPVGAGNGDQVGAYTVRGLRPQRVPLAMRGGHPLSRFVGREHELAALRAVLGQVERGHGQVVGLVGEPGVGKSRFLFEFQQRLTAQRITWLQGRCLSYGSTIPYLPVLDLLKSYFHLEEHDDGQKIRDKLTRKILTLDRSLEDTLPYLFSLLAVSEPTAALQQMDPQLKRRRTFEAIKRLLLRESLNQPLLLLVEDLHWLDSESQAFLTVLSESLTAARVLLLATYRPEHQHGWGSKMYYAQLRLDPLGREEAEELLTALLGQGADLQDLKRFILAKTEGNPFFLEEIVQALADQGVLVRSPGGGAGFKLAPTTPP